MAKPVGWRKESQRHALASKGIKTGSSQKTTAPKYSPQSEIYHSPEYQLSKNMEYFFSTYEELGHGNVTDMTLTYESKPSKTAIWRDAIIVISTVDHPDGIVIKYGSERRRLDKIMTSMINNAALLIKRIDAQFYKLAKEERLGTQEAKRLADLKRSVMEDVPQLINRPMGVD